MPAKRRPKIKVFVSSRSIAGFTKSSLEGTNYIRRQATILALLSLAHDVAVITFPAETPHGRPDGEIGILAFPLFKLWPRELLITMCQAEQILKPIECLIVGAVV